jgi:hypothetical protein
VALAIPETQGTYLKSPAPSNSQRGGGINTAGEQNNGFLLRFIGWLYHGQTIYQIL